MNRKALTLFLIILITLNLPLMLLFNVFKLSAFNFDFYEQQFYKNGAYNLGFTKEKIDSTAQYLIGYLRYDTTSDPPNIDIYDDDENLHMLEVKEHLQYAVFLGRVFLLLFVFMIILLFFADKRNIDKTLGVSLISGGILTLLIFILFVFSVLLDFDDMFTLFHQLIFTGNWIFPSASNMIRMFPQQFFSSLAFKIVANTLLYALVGILCGVFIFFIKKLTKRYINKLY